MFFWIFFDEIVYLSTRAPGARDARVERCIFSKASAVLIFS